MKDDIRIIKQIGIISNGETGWQKELNVVSINEGPFQYDLREWSLDHSNYRNGISFENDEATVLLAVLKECFKDGGEGISLDQFPEALPDLKKPGQVRFVLEEESADSSGDDTLLKFLSSENIDYVDKRSKGGALWIVGGHEFDNVMLKCKEMGYRFNFSEKGGRITKGNPGWYYRDKRQEE